MKKLLLIVASLALGGLAWAASNSACIFNLIPPTSAVQVCQDGSGQMNLQDATAGPLTLSSLGGWTTYISTSAGSVTVSSTLTASKGITTSTLSVTGAAGASVTYGVTVGSVTTPLVTVSTAVVTSSMTVQGAGITASAITTAGQLNYGTFLVPTSSAVLVSAAATQILPAASFIELNPNNVAVNLALTSKPTISTSTLGANGGTAFPDGMWLVVAGTSSVTALRLQDNGTLSGSELNLGNGNTYVTVSSTLSAVFQYNANSTMWNYIGGAH